MNDILVVLLREHWLQLATGILLPAAVGLATQLHAHPAVKSLANFVLALVAGALEAITVNGGVIDLEQIVSYMIAIFVASHISYKAVWKPIGGGVSDPVRLATPDFGVKGPPAGTEVRAA